MLAVRIYGEKEGYVEVSKFIGGITIGVNTDLHPESEIGIDIDFEDAEELGKAIIKMARDAKNNGK